MPLTVGAVADNCHQRILIELILHLAALASTGNGDAVFSHLDLLLSFEHVDILASLQLF